MNVDEMIAKLREHKKAGLGKATVVMLNGTSEGSTHVRSVHRVDGITIRPDHVAGPSRRKTVFSDVVDGRGAPIGTERAVQIG